MDPFSTVRDSSIWQSSSNFSVFRGKDAFLRIGLVKKVYQDAASTELRYLVTVFDRSDETELNCRLMRRFGGVYNYEDVVYQGYTFTDQPDPVSSLQAKAGDIVLVAYLNGEAREGIILGGVMHAARTSTIDIDNGPQYMSEFNGVQTTINQDGEYTMTFRGIPTNIDILAQTPSAPIPAPTYDTKVGTSFFKLDKTGSLELNDNATDGLQNLRIDKAKGFVEINAGKVSLKMTKASEEVDLTSKILKMNATTSATMNSPKIAIGGNGIELLDQITQALQDIIKFLNSTDSTHTHTGNLGYPTSPPTQASQFTALGSQLQGIHDSISSIKGSL